MPLSLWSKVLTEYPPEQMASCSCSTDEEEASDLRAIDHN